jgi:tripartite-type tricarboxylate transporter receptor subunit TctC
MKRRHCLFGAAAATLAATGAMRAFAQAGPTHVVIGFAPGGSVDALARLVGESIAAATGRPAIVESKTGAAGRLAVDLVKAAAPDGDTLLVAPQGPMTLFPYVFNKLRFDPAKDFTPITRLVTGDFALTVGPAVPAKDVAALRDWLKTVGDKASYGSPGSGTLPHFVGVAVARQMGVPMTHIPYQCSAKSMIDLAGGTIPMTISPVTEALELHKAGRVRILATTGSTRTTFVSGVPTFKEQGFDVEVPLWFAVYGPAGMAPATVDKLRAAIDKGFAAEPTVQRLAKLGLVPAPLSPAELEALRKRESAMWATVVKESGFAPTD